MPNTHALQGKYELDFGSAEWNAAVGSVELHSEVDQPTRLLVTFAQNAPSIAKLSGSKLPATASLKWQDMGIFKGTIIHSRLLSHSQLIVTFADSLFLAKKTLLNGFFKKQTLKEVLEKLAKESKLKARFQGSFADKLPGLNVGGKSVYDLFSSLSSKYGFYFTYRSFSDTLHFVRLGESIKAQKMNCRDDASDISIGQAGSEAYSQVTLRYFDPKSMETKENKIGQSALYKPISGFAEHPTYRHKLQWKSAEGTIESHVTDLYHFESADDVLSTELSKKLMEQETVRLKCFKPLALPGDKLTLSEAPAGALQDGAYFVKSMGLYINSSLPVAEIFGIRP